MTGIIIIFSLIKFGPPLALLLIAISRYNTDREDSTKLFILVLVWFIIGGGICASMGGF